MVCVLWAAPGLAQDANSNSDQNRTGVAPENDPASIETDDRIRVVGNVLYSDQINALRTPTPIIELLME